MPQSNVKMKTEKNHMDQISWFSIEYQDLIQGCIKVHRHIQVYPIFLNVVFEF